MLKWQNDVCECGLDLTTASPLDEVFRKDEAGKVIAFGVCPKCLQPQPMIEVEETAPKAEPAAEEKPASKGKGARRAAAPGEV